MPLFLIVISTFCACLSTRDSVSAIEVDQGGFQMTLPIGFDSIPIPEGSEFSEARVQLGRKLFFDPSLSKDSTVSCGSCHQPARYFTDGLPKSIGIEQAIVDRNAPSLINVAYQPYLLREGGVPTLEMQVSVPVQEHREFNFNMVLLAQRLKADSTYARAAMEAYDRELDPYVISRALACYERTLVSGSSPFDKFNLQGMKSALSRKAVQGYELFSSARLSCTTCHSGFDLTNYSVECNGLYEEYEDPGRARLTGAPSDEGKFKVPSLRNVAETAPYMHDGSLYSLEQVIEHYASGGAPHPNKSDVITGFELNEIEKEQLLAFLRSLTDEKTWDVEGF